MIDLLNLCIAHWSELIITALTGIVLGYIKNEQANMVGTRALLFDKLKEYHKVYFIDNKCISVSDLEDVKIIYDAYSNMHGKDNAIGKKMYNDILSLPPPEHMH